MSDNIVFPCPACGTKYSVGPHHAGKKTKCKKCAAPITVPSPQVANPTIVGRTRTIRRADIPAGAGAGENVARSERETNVDMKGGASVMRKSETVVPPPPVARTPTRRSTGASKRVGAAPPRISGRRQPTGRPMPPGMAPPQKNNTPLIIGAIGGGVGLILIIILLVVVTGDNTGTSTDGAQPGQDGQQQQVADKEEQAKQRLLKDLQTKYNNQAGLNFNEIKSYYDTSKKMATDDPDFTSQRDNWAMVVIRKAETDVADPKELAKIALEMDDAGYPGSGALLEKACEDMIRADVATGEKETIDEDSGRMRKKIVADSTFLEVAKRLGWEDYKRPEDMNEAAKYEVEGAQEYESFFSFDVEQVYRDIDLYPPELIEDLKEKEQSALEAYNKLVAQNKKDGYAFNAREAWIRFKHANKAGKVNRTKGQRSFSPEAMRRDNEDFDEIWTYTYWKPFMVFIEKPPGVSRVDDEFLETLESKAALLQHLYAWFDENMIQRFDLERQKPRYNAKQAEEENWPLEIVVLKDSPTFDQYIEDESGNPMPGARAFYSPLESRVMTWDDRENTDADTLWFNESVIIHESFHMLSDFYGANPKFTMEDFQSGPRYANILVQEGLTDSVAGFVREGKGLGSKYEFLRINHLRLDSFQQIYELCKDQVVFRVRDQIECRSYLECSQVAFKRGAELKLNPVAVMQNALGFFYPTACVTSYFFMHYEEDGEHPYRDKWWKYIGEDYTGKITLTSYTDNRGVKRFKEIFEIESDEDWDALEKKWLDYTLALDPEDVGSGGGGEISKDDLEKKEGDEDGVLDPRELPVPEEALVPTGKRSACTGRDEE